MKLISTILAILGGVGIIAVILEIFIGWQMIPQSIFVFIAAGSCIVFVLSLIMRCLIKDGKNVKQSGIALIIVGIIMLIATFLGMFSSNGNSSLYKLVNRSFVPLLIFGCLYLLFGIIFRSVGKSIEQKASETNKQ